MKSLLDVINESLFESKYPKLDITSHKIGYYDSLFYCLDKETEKLYIIGDFVKGQGKIYYKIFSVPEKNIDDFVSVAKQADNDDKNRWEMKLPIELRQLERLDNKSKGFNDLSGALKFLYKNILKY